MLDDVKSVTVPTPYSAKNEAPAFLPVPEGSLDAELTGLAIWVSWSGSEAELRARLKPMGVLEQFTLIDLEREADAESLWMVWFHHVGRSPDRDGQTLALLRRVGVCAPWVRVERAPQATEECARDHSWRAVAAQTGA